MPENTGTDPRALLDQLAALPPQQARALARTLDERGAEFGVFPLSAAQSRMWLLDELRPGSPVSNVPFAYRVSGELDIPALEAALADVVRRHESLRTVFVTVGDEPRQIVLPDQPVRVSVTRPEPGARTDEWTARARAAEAARPFDLATGPLLRAHLLLPPAGEPVLLLTFHHIVCDGWSMAIVFADLSRSYAARVSGTAPGLPELPLQYADFAVWQRDRLAGQARSRLVGFWREQLDGLPPLLELPADAPRPATRTFQGAQEEFRWERDLSDAVDRFCRAEGVTPFVVLLAAFTAVVQRYTGRTDIPIATVLANRNRLETEQLVGFFANTVVLRTRVPGPVGLRELVRTVRAAADAAQEHQDLPFEALVEELRPQRDPSYDPVAQVLFVLQDGPAAVPELTGATLEPVATHSGTAKFDLTFSVWQLPREQGGGLAGAVEYSTPLFERETVRRLLGHVRTLLAAALAEPDRPLGDLPMLTVAEQEQLRAWNPVDPPVDQGVDAVELIEGWADRSPRLPALVAGETAYDYGELEERANRLGNHLRRSGVRPGSLVGVALDRSAELPVAFLAVLKAGAVYLPLDPAYPEERLSYMIGDAGMSALITRSGLLRAAVAPEVLVVDLDGCEARIAACPPDRPRRTPHPDDAAYVIYTSGSTGRPKGTVVPHRGLRNCALAKNEVYGLGPGDTVLQSASASFDASISEFLLALAAGARLCLAPREELLPGPDLARTVRTYGVSAAILPPSALGVMEPGDLPGLRTLIVVGEACPPEVVAGWAPGRAFYDAYGPTESTIWATVARCDGSEYRPPIGRPIRGIQAHVLDEAQRPVPIGVPGELYLGGLGVVRGYLGRPGLTAERFLPDPFSGRAGARLYRTGDLVRRLPDGALDYLGRTDRQLKVRGHRIEPGEIEKQLDRLPGVTRSVVTMRQEPSGHARLVAHLQADRTGDAPAPEPEAVRRALAGVLPEFMLPSAVVVLDALPLTDNGKVDVARLPAPARAATRQRSRPASALERDIAHCWQELLGATDIGPHENFFDLGGNSLLLSKARVRLGAVLGRDIPALLLFRHPTVHDLAVALSEPTGAPRGDAAGTDAAEPDSAARIAAGRRALAARSRRIGGRR